VTVAARTNERFLHGSHFLRAGIVLSMKNLLYGFGIGLAIGLLYAPAAGRQTRRRVIEKAEDLKRVPRRNLARVINIGRRKAGEAGREAAEHAYDEATKRVIGETPQNLNPS